MKKQNWRSDLARDLIAFSAISPSKLTMCLDSLHKSCRKKPAQNKPATFFGSKKKTTARALVHGTRGNWYGPKYVLRSPCRVKEKHPGGLT